MTQIIVPLFVLVTVALDLHWHFFLVKLRTPYFQLM